MVKTAEKAGIPWKQTVAELQACNEVRACFLPGVEPGVCMHLSDTAGCICAFPTACHLFRLNSLSLLQLEQLRVELTDPDLVYPGYAERKFHAYDGGNLDWLAVWEVEPATAATAVRILRPDTMAPEEATTTMRQSFIHSVQVGCPWVQDVRGWMNLSGLAAGVAEV